MHGSIGDNLRRLMAQAGCTHGELSRQSQVDRRTIQGLLEGRRKSNPRTLRRLADALGVAADEFFLQPAQLLYRRLDRITNPRVEEVVEDRPALFDGWTEADFDELQSRFAAGGCLTADGVVTVAAEMNLKRDLHEKLSLLLETHQADLVRGFLEMVYQQVVVAEPLRSPGR